MPVNDGDHSHHFLLNALNTLLTRCDSLPHSFICVRCVTIDKPFCGNDLPETLAITLRE
jgi:hypothetical protein